MALFTNDARLTLPRRPSADGRAQIRDHLSILLHEGNVRLSLEPTPGASRILEGQNVEERGRFTLEIRTTQGDLRSWTGPYELEGRLADGLKLTRLTLDAEP
ncbi:MAG TPA: hypothetical protein VLK65_32680 [Vicinamibacteria bacterium]|nr:hypothetical protein [Vicinamibacteria bacterium]